MRNFVQVKRNLHKCKQDRNVMRAYIISILGKEVIRLGKHIVYGPRSYKTSETRVLHKAQSCPIPKCHCLLSSHIEKQTLELGNRGDQHVDSNQPSFGSTLEFRQNETGYNGIIDILK